MKQDIEINKLDLTLSALDAKINELDLQLLDIVSNIKYGIALSEEKKKKGMEVASLSANAMIELQNMKQSGKMDEKAAGYMQAGAAIVGVGALIYTGVMNLKEKAQILDYLKQVKEMEGNQAKLISFNYDKMTQLLNELQDAIQNTIMKTVDNLSKFQLPDNRAVDVLQKLHGFVTRYFDFTQKYHVFNAYKEHFALYMDKEVFSLDLPLQKAVEVKEAFLSDLNGFFKKMNNGSGTVGMQYMILNHNLFLSNKLFKDERTVIKGNSIKEIAKVVNMTKRLSELKKTPLHKIVDKNIKEIESIGSERSANKEKLGKAIGHVMESGKENQKKGNIQTEQLLLEYIGTMISEERGIDKEKMKGFDMRILQELVNWYEGAARFKKVHLIVVSLLFAVIAYFVFPLLIIFTPVVYWLMKRSFLNKVVYTNSDKRRLDSLFGQGTIFHFWMIDRLGRHDIFTNILKKFKG